MTQTHKEDIYGVIGGMGPLASAEFLKTVYEYSLGEREQESPIVLMYSDPTFPDRTEAFLAGRSDPLLKRLITALHRLRHLNASRIVICCITMHYLLPRLPDDLRRRIISLLDVIFAGILRTTNRHLLICTNATRELGLFQGHSDWEISKDQIVLPDQSDQELIHHELIYQVKKNRPISELSPLLETLLMKYRVDSFIAGCTEIHLLAKSFIASADPSRGYGCIDPLCIVAKEMAQSAVCRSREMATAS